jgi:hypothetical protein
MLDLLATEPNWIVVSVVGAVLGAVVARFGGVLTFPFRRTKEPVGVWNVYHHTFRQGSLQLVWERMTISKAPLGGLKVVVKDPMDPDSQIYRGSVAVEGGAIVVITMRGSRGFGTNGLVSIRLQSRLPPDHRVMYGMWLAYDHDGCITAGTVVISRDELGEDTRATVQNWFDFRHGAMRLLRQARVAVARKQGPAGHPDLPVAVHPARSTSWWPSGCWRSVNRQRQVGPPLRFHRQADSAVPGPSPSARWRPVADLARQRHRARPVDRGAEWLENRNDAGLGERVAELVRPASTDGVHERRRSDWPDCGRPAPDRSSCEEVSGHPGGLTEDGDGEVGSRS